MIRKLLLLVMAVASIYGCHSIKPSNDTIPDVEYDLYLLLGQSNMVGYAPLEEKDTAAIRGVWLLNDKGEIIPATSPINRFSTIRFMGQTYYGLGSSFSKRVRHQTGRYILLVSNARGGSAIAEWQKESTYNFYSESVRRTKQALAHPGVKLKAILWHQGESDCTRPEFEDYWYSHLSKMVEDFRADFGNPELPIVIGQTYAGASYADKMNPVMEKVSDYISFSSWVSSEGCADLGDAIHFSRDGYDLIGARYADEIIKLCYPEFANE